MAVGYGRWSLTRGGRTWRFNCIQIEADNTPLNLQKCSYHKQPNPILFENIKIDTEKIRCSLSNCVSYFTDRLALHPRKQVLATVSDDWSWKMWAVPR